MPAHDSRRSRQSRGGRRMLLQLYMWEGIRRIILDAHRLYVDQPKTWLLAQFKEFAVVISDFWSVMPERL